MLKQPASAWESMALEQISALMAVLTADHPPASYANSLTTSTLLIGSRATALSIKSNIAAEKCLADSTAAWLYESADGLDVAINALSAVNGRRARA